MLVLSRRPGERIRIGDAVELVVLKIRGSRVQLGVVAPHDVSVLRGELKSIPQAVPSDLEEAADYQEIELAIPSR
jgi:carbon storage regulator